MAITRKFCTLAEAAKALMDAGVSATLTEAKSDLALAVRDKQLKPRFFEFSDFPRKELYYAELAAFKADWKKSTLVLTTRDGWGRSWNSISGAPRPVPVELFVEEVEALCAAEMAARKPTQRALVSTVKDVALARKIVGELAQKGHRLSKRAVLEYCRREGCAKLAKERFDFAVWAEYAPSAWREKGRLSKAEIEIQKRLLSIPFKNINKFNK